MDAHVAICTSTGQEILTIHVDDLDPFIVLTLRGATLELTRTEARKVSDALRASALRKPYETNLGQSNSSP